MIARIWAAMWPNIFAPSFFTATGLALSHFRLRRHITIKHDELKRHVSNEAKTSRLADRA